MEIKQYYIAVYRTATLERSDETDESVDKSEILDEITFYEKRYYCAHIKESTYETSDPEELSHLARDDESEGDGDEDEDENEVTLEEGEWIEDLSESVVVCTHPETEEEVDGIEYLEGKG